MRRQEFLGAFALLCAVRTRRSAAMLGIRRTFRIVFFLLVPFVSAAAAAPTQLYKKSVLVTWSEDRVSRFIGASVEDHVHSTHSVVVYVSGAGRVFHRYSARVGPNTGANERLAGSEHEQSGRNARFVERSILIENVFKGGGARRIEITFDGNYTTCTATVINGLAAGETKSVRKSVISGRVYELLSSKTSAATCDMQSGNAFAE